VKVLLIVSLFLLIVLPASAENIKISFDNSLSDWQEKIFHGKVNYQIVEEDGHRFLRAETEGNASALIYWQDIDPNIYSKIRWRWKIQKVLEKGHAGEKSGDDYPARIYIIFDSWLPNFARSINYIWASKVDREALVVSPYYSRSIMLAVKSGNAAAGNWVVEERDLIADYKRAFGGKIPMIKAIAIMSDGDDTGESATAWYDWVEFVAD